MESTAAKKQYTWKSLVVLLVITLGLAGISGFLTRDNMDVYATLSLPSFAPPGWAFPVAWGILYPAMAVAAWLSLRQLPENALPIALLYGAQLLANVIWPLLFFLQHAWGLSFVWLLLVFALALVTCLRFFQSSKWGRGIDVALPGLVGFCGGIEFLHCQAEPTVKLPCESCRLRLGGAARLFMEQHGAGPCPLAAFAYNIKAR